MAIANLVQNPYLSSINYVIDSNPDVLARIYDDEVNMAVYKRTGASGLKHFVSYMLENKSSYSFVQVLDRKEIKQALQKSLPATDYSGVFIDDVDMLCDMYGLLFGQEKIGVRLTVLEHAMCPRFHVDNVTCRLLSTYNGTGTEWLTEANLDRTKLGRGNNGLPDEQSGVYKDEQQIKRLDTFDVALLKGEGWPNNHGRGIVHRSPAASASNSRLVLSLDSV